MIELVELIELAGVKLGNYKIHCAVDDVNSSWRPLQAYYTGEFDAGQAWQRNENFKCDTIITLINLFNSEKWLFVGVYEVNGVSIHPDGNGLLYDLIQLPGLGHLDGRAIVAFPKKFRATYLVGAKHRQSMIITAIREERMSIADFPGFNSVKITFDILKALYRQDNPSWRTALSSVAGVYAITDSTTGEIYIGSAYGGIGIWQRWEVYAATGHGNNKELRSILREKGEDHRHAFQFSLLEVLDINSGKDFVIGREGHWKDVFLTRQFGLNWN